MNIDAYLNDIRKLYNSGQTTEHSFRPALAALFQSISDDIQVINEPKQLIDVGAPDFVFARNDVSIGWCEAKDLGKDISKFKASDYSKAQKERYTKGLPNLIYTNGTDFEFILRGEKIAFITIADFIPTLPAREQNFADLENMLREFVAQTPISISGSKPLAEMMAGKAVIIKDIIGKALVQDRESNRESELNGQYEAFKANLIHDISVADFADIYAETIAYGLFAARLHDTTLDTFSRGEALELLPKSNPFLRKLFIYIAGPDLDERLRWIVDETCDVFRATDLHAILENFGKFTARNDPFLHFYETFLAEYNPKKRKARGVWYTPEPVVNFIVRAVDDVLKTEFNLPDGLADTSKINVDWDTGQTDNKGNPVTIKKDVHRVQILDPATGTGTFLAEVIKQISARVHGIAPSQWSSYVENDLIPRIHGFELLMASYAMCHMKLDMMLTEMGYKPSATPPRLGVYLTNSLEEGEKVEQNLFAQWLANEAKEASDIKRQTPIMCVIGNPPYSGESANKGAYIMDLIDAYKKEPGGIKKLKERNPKWINDDYVKFMRFAENMIAKNGEGILGFITNHGYLDNPTFRGMRWHLLKTFDKIYVLDLHGNSKKKEVCPDGSPDKNVFDIMQGVAIIIGVKKRDDGNGLAEVYHGDLWGSRKVKNEALWANGTVEASSNLTKPREPHYLLIPRNYEIEATYLVGFSLLEMLPNSVMGFQTHRDSFAIGWTKQEIQDRCNILRNETTSDSELKDQFKLRDNRDWNLAEARATIKSDANWELKISQCLYRPFDNRICYLSYVAMDYPRTDLIQNGLNVNNLFLGVGRQGLAVGSIEWCLATVSEFPMDANIFRRGGVNAAPLYLYPEEGSLDQSIRLNFDPKIYAAIREKAGLSTAPFNGDNDGFRDSSGDDRPDEVKVFDYIYGVLHCPEYRETYKEFLKIDFPRIPYPASPESFAAISTQGEALRRLHLMETPAIGDTPFSFDGSPPEEQDCMVDKVRYENNRVYINGKAGSGQYFDNVPMIAWEFYIGGYQPAQKWLKDRKGRTLSWDDIRHYQKIIKILMETDRVMKGIEMPSNID